MFLHRTRNEIPFVVTDRKEVTHQDIRSPRYAPSVEPALDLGKDTHLKNYIEGKPLGNTS